MRVIRDLVAVGLAFVSLEGVAVAETTTNSQSAGRDPDQVICRATADTGSLVRRNRQCHTRQQWDQMAREGREQARNLQTLGTGTTGH